MGCVPVHGRGVGLDPGIRTRSIVEPAFTEWHTNEIEKTKAAAFWILYF